VCAADKSVIHRFRAPSQVETDAARRVMSALRERDGRAVGQLHRDLFGERMERRTLEHILAALVRAGEVRMREDEFVKEGETIRFQRVHLGPAAKTEEGEAARLEMLEEPKETSRGKGKGKGRRFGGRKERRSRGSRTVEGTADSAANPGVESALRAWRTSMAKKLGVPAFRVLTDRTLVGIATEVPADEQALLGVSGIGPALLAKYGRALLGVVARAAPRNS
jgi:superfamily II DNA helicase RecQ